MAKPLTLPRSKKAGLPPGSLVHIGDRFKEEPEITVLRYDSKELHERQTSDVAECVPLPAAPGVTWINVDGVHDAPTLQQLGQSLRLHPLVLEDILNTGQRPKMEAYGDYVYIVAKMLTLKEDSVESEQVSIVLSKDYLLSFQEQGKPGDVFDAIRSRLKSGSGRLRSNGADFLAYSLIDAIVDHYFVVLERLGERLELLEDQLVQAPTTQTMTCLHQLRREVIFLRKCAWPMREVVSGLQRSETPLITEATAIYLRDVYDHAVYVMETVDTFRDMLANMLDIYLSSISARMNEVMKVLTIIATLFIPLTFIVGVYGMNFDYFPELKWRWAYPVLWIIMIGIAGAMLVYFRRKHWL